MWPFSRRREEPAPKAMASNVDVAKLTTSAEIAAFLRGEELGSFSGQNVAPTAAMRVAAVYRCVEILSNVAASARIKIKDKTTNEVRGPEDDLDYMLNDMSSRNMSAFHLRKTMEVHKLFRGDGFARVVRGFRNRPVALQLMHTDAVTVRQLDDLSLEYTYTAPSGAKLTLPQDEVLHVMGPSYDGICGQSVLGAARNQVGFAIATEKHTSSLFTNGTNIGDILSHPDALSPEQISALQDTLESYRNPENAHKTLILQGGLKHDKVGMTQADAEFVLSRKLGIVEICMFFGVPPHIVGLTENQTSYGQGVEHQGIAFVNYNLDGLFSSWESAIGKAFLADNRREKAEFDDSRLMRGDMKSRWEAWKIAREIGALNADEIRGKEGEPSRPGGDDFWDQPNAAREVSNEDAA